MRIDDILGNYYQKPDDLWTYEYFMLE